MVYANDVSHSEQGSASGLGPAPGSDHTGFNEVGRGRGGRRAQWIVVRARRPRRTLGRQSGVPLLLPTAAANAWPRRPALLSRARSITGMTDTRGSLTLTAAAALQGRPPPALTPRLRAGRIAAAVGAPGSACSVGCQAARTAEAFTLAACRWRLNSRATRCAALACASWPRTTGTARSNPNDALACGRVALRASSQGGRYSLAASAGRRGWGQACTAWSRIHEKSSLAERRGGGGGNAGLAGGGGGRAVRPRRAQLPTVSITS